MITRLYATLVTNPIITIYNKIRNKNFSTVFTDYNVASGLFRVSLKHKYFSHNLVYEGRSIKELIYKIKSDKFVREQLETLVAKIHAVVPDYKFYFLRYDDNLITIDSDEYSSRSTFTFYRDSVKVDEIPIIIAGLLRTKHKGFGLFSESVARLIVKKEEYVVFNLFYGVTPPYYSVYSVTLQQFILSNSEPILAKARLMGVI